MGFMGNGAHATKQNQILRERKSLYFKRNKAFQLSSKKVINDLDTLKLARIEKEKLKSQLIEFVLYSVILGSAVYYLFQAIGF